jgi:hypothetical protein
MDSFDQVPNDQNQLLIHRMEMSRELQVTMNGGRAKLQRSDASWLLPLSL